MGMTHAGISERLRARQAGPLGEYGIAAAG
jgi:hypothetical protein